jgi:mannose-6-phosphate isomerase-like protein (cupin superfamily)
LKICAVISGRVQVRLGKDRFGIGRGGVLRVRGGEECVVRNEEKKGVVVWVVCVK